MAERSDASVLSILGAAFFLGGLALCIMGVAALANALPPTFNTGILVFFGLGIGFAFVITGFMYTVVARSSEEMEVGEKGLSITRDPLTGLREWIPVDTIEAAIVRPWLMSPWFKGPRYVEVELKVKEGGMTLDDRFYVHLGQSGEERLEPLRKVLGSKLEVTLRA